MAMTIEEALTIVSHYSYLHRSDAEKRVYNDAVAIIREHAHMVMARELSGTVPEPDEPDFPMGDRNHLKAGRAG